MKPDRYERVQEIFLAARALHGEERARLLDRACAGDAELRRDVESLLTADSPTAEGFLESPALGPGFHLGEGAHAGLRPSNPEEPMPERIGAYRLLQRLGEGGFGVVYAADQERPVRRRVALKIIKLGMDTRQVIARFEQERQALALMDHPNIAKVLDAGATETGRPYFVMELVKGEPITTYCDKQNLSIQERLELFAQVCAAVQHAHTKGVIHRDIKPSNVLVSTQDGRPFAKVIDFGIAKATNARLTEKTVYTEHHQLIGTPEYMSPEQAEGSLDIDTRTDVYSLGVLLYELLTGSTPFDSQSLRSAAYAEIQRIIREVDPPRPSTRLSNSAATLAGIAAHRRIEPRRLGTIIRGELDWIVMKALEKDRQRRYETASGLALDIRRHLAGEPVVAAPPSSLYRMRKFARRNRAAVLAGGVVVAALILASGVSVWFGLRESAAQQRESEQRAEAVRLQGVAEANAAAETKARTRAEGINTFVIDALQSSDPRAGGEQSTTIAQAMQSAIKKIDSGAFKSDQETETVLRDTIATIFQNNGEYTQAESQFRRALDIREGLLKNDDPLVAESLNNLAGLYVLQGELTKAEPLHLRALAIFEKAPGPDQSSLAASLSNLAGLYIGLGRFDEAEPLLERALTITEKALGPEHADVASIQYNLASLYHREGKLDKAEPLYKRSLAATEKVLGPNHPDIAGSLNNLALLYTTQGRFEQAEPLYVRSLAIGEKALGPDHPDVAATLTNLAYIYKLKGQFAEAEPLYLRALAIRTKTFGPDHPDIATSLSNLAQIRQSLGRTAEARQGFDDAVAMLRRLSPNGSAPLARMLWRSEAARLEIHDPAAATKELEEAVAMGERVLPPDSPPLKEYRDTLARCRAALSK